MPLPLGLTAAGRFVYHFYYSGFRRGMTATDIIREIRKAGYGYRATEMLADARIARRAVIGDTILEALPLKPKIRDEYYVPVDRTVVANRYASRGYFRYRDRITGEEFEDHLVLGHDAPLSPAEIRDIEFKRIQEWREYRDLELIEFRLTGAWRGLGWR